MMAVSSCKTGRPSSVFVAMMDVKMIEFDRTDILEVRGEPCLAGVVCHRRELNQKS